MISDERFVDNVATEILLGIEEVYGYAEPKDLQLPFKFIQPYYSSSAESNFVLRIVSACEALEKKDKVKLEIFKMALLEAINRCITMFHGSASRLLALLDLNYLLNKSALPANIWARLMNCNNPEQPQLTIRFLDGLVRRLIDWEVKPPIDSIPWKRLVNNVSIAELPSTGEWLLGLAEQDHAGSKSIFSCVWDRLISQKDLLFEYWSDLYQVKDILLSAFMPDLSLKEKKSSLDELISEVDGDFLGGGVDFMRRELEEANQRFINGSVVGAVMVNVNMSAIVWVACNGKC